MRDMTNAVALVREPGTSFVHAISQHTEKNTINVERAREQHRLYAETLKDMGLSVVHLKIDETYPDGPFVEDTAIALPDRAWICSLKAESRRGETEPVFNEIKKYRPVETIRPPAYIDGGDVLNIDGTLYVGLSSRTNRETIEILRLHHPVIPVPVRRGLHLKSSVSHLGGKTLVINPENVESTAFAKFDWVVADKHENANCLGFGGKVLMAAGYPLLADRIRRKGFEVVELPIGEFEKADGGITCLSLIIPLYS